MSLFLALPLMVPCQDLDPAAALLAKAEQQAAKGFYDQARRSYRELLEKYEDTPEGRLAKARSEPSAYLGKKQLVDHGPPANRVDVLLMGDGYTLKHMNAFDKLADDVPPLFERQNTFREYYSYLNFTRVGLLSAESGVDGFGREYDTALNARTLGTDAGHVGIDYALTRRRMDEAGEHDGLAIVYVKTGVAGTGGGGIAAIGGRGIKITIHEWGHAFGRLQDEYSSHTHDRGVPRSGINISATEDEDTVPWSHWLKAKVPDVGMYEGGAGQVRDVWRPTASGCIMNNAEFFCRVCREALILRIYQLVDPIDEHYPPTVPVESPVGLLMRPDDKLEFRVNVMQPDSHELEVRWWILKEREAPRRGGSAGDGRYGAGEAEFGDRRDRGAYHDVLMKPASVSKHNRTGEHTFVLKPKDVDGSGRYRVLCRVVDTTELRGERYPWVLDDPHHLLQSERGWWVEVRD
jgi:hypothetical protein